MTFRLPFVSRDRYDEKAAEVVALKAEREKLLDRISNMSGHSAIYAEAEHHQPAHEDQPAPRYEMPPARPTLEQVTRAANSAAQKSADSGISLIRTIQESTLKGFKIPNAS